MQYALSFVFLEKNMALTFSDVRKSLKGSAAVIPYVKSLLGHYRYNDTNETLSRGDMGTGYRVIISGHMEQDSLGEDVFVVNIRMDAFSTNTQILLNASRAFDDILVELTMVGQNAVVRSAHMSRTALYRHTTGTGEAGEQTVRFNAEGLLQTDRVPNPIPVQERKRQFFFKFYPTASDVENIEILYIPHVNESLKEDSNGDFVPVINWMNRRVEVFLEHMGNGNFAVLFRVLESSLVGHDIEDVLGTLEGQIREELRRTYFTGANWIITPLGPQGNETTRWDPMRNARRRRRWFYESDAIPEYTTNLQSGNSSPPLRPQRVELGTTFTLQQFQELGPFYISEKLILDDLTQDDEEAGCSLLYDENIEYPVLVTSENDERVYCAEEIARWVGEQGNTLNEIRVPIVSIHVMTREEVIAKEKTKLKKKKEDLEKELEKLIITEAPVGKIRQLRFRVSRMNYESLKATREQARKNKRKREEEDQPPQQRRRLRLLNMSFKQLKF